MQRLSYDGVSPRLQTSMLYPGFSHQCRDRNVNLWNDPGLSWLGSRIEWKGQKTVNNRREETFTGKVWFLKLWLDPGLSAWIKNWMNPTWGKNLWTCHTTDRRKIHQSVVSQIVAWPSGKHEGRRPPGRKLKNRPLFRKWNKSNIKLKTTKKTQKYKKNTILA